MMTRITSYAAPFIWASALFAIHPHGCMGHPTTAKQAAEVHFSNEELAHISETIEPEADRCNSQIVDVHLHDAFWFDTAAPLLAEMDASFISKAIMLAVYGPVKGPFGGDPNEVVEEIVSQSGGRIFGLASLNTTVPSWEEEGAAELERLSTFLAKPNFVGTKIAPPHTCMALNSEIMHDVVQTVSASPSPLMFIHIGTTPFCGPFGAAILGRPGCCNPEFVDPTFMEDLIQEYTNTTFVLVHVGADFLPPTDEYFYNGDNVGKSISLAANYDNVFLEISAFLRQDNHTDVYPGSTTILQQIADAGLASKTMYGSDVNSSPNAMGAYLSTAIEKMIEAGFTDEERCMILSDNTIKVFGLESSTESPIQNDAAADDDETLEVPQNPEEELGGEGDVSSAPSLSAVANTVLAAVLMSLTIMI